MDQVERQEKMVGKTLDEEDELKKQYRSEWEYSRRKKTFDLITYLIRT